MRKNIDIEETTLTKLKVLSALENISVKRLMEKAVQAYVYKKEQEQMDNMTQEEKEDLGLLALMQQADRSEQGTEADFFEALHEK
jgi:hypothetical protein